MWQISTVQGETNRLQFLQEIDTIQHYASSLGAAAEQLPFSFVIPKELLWDAPVADSRFLRLCPTVKLGCTFEQYPSKARYMQPLIYYRLVATAYATDDNQRTKLPQCEREIAIQPTQSADPPIYAELFKKEYRLHCSVRLRRHLYHRSSGELELSASEPSPFNLCVTAPRSSTTVSVKLSFVPKRSMEPVLVPYDWTFLVKSFLRMRVFYSTRPLESEPTMADVGFRKQVFVHERSTTAEVREYSNLSWRMDRLSKPDEQDDIHHEMLPWTAKLPVSINAPKTLPPTFLTLSAALRYSIVLQVTVVGMQLSSAEIEVPVQMIRDRSVLNAVKDSISLWMPSSSPDIGVEYNEGDDNMESSAVECGLDYDSGHGIGRHTALPPKYRRFV